MIYKEALVRIFLYTREESGKGAYKLNPNQVTEVTKYLCEMNRFNTEYDDKILILKTIVTP